MKLMRRKNEGALDDGLQELIAKKRGLIQQQSTISDEIRNLDYYQYKNWVNLWKS